MKYQRHIIESLKKRDTESAMTLILEEFNDNPVSPWPHLYLGILKEILKKPNLAMHHYRAALALDGTNRTALNNLYRLGEGKRQPIYYGDEGDSQ